jgi:transglutaminase-like putative cysteine protease
VQRPDLEPGIAIQRAGVALLVAAGAASAIGNIFIDNGWILPTGVAVVAAVALSLLWRLLRVPTPISVALSVVLGAAWLSAWWPLSSSLAWLDRPGALADGLRLANQEIVTQVAPTPTLNGLMLVTVAGTFLVTVVITELMFERSVLTALLAALVLWSVPLSVPVPDRTILGPSLALLVPAAIALAVVSDPATGTRDQPIRLRLIAALAGVSMVMLAIPIATALPGHDGAPLVDLRGLGTTLEASQPLVDVGDQLRLPAPRPVMTVRTDAPAYLRTAALEVFDGNTWRIGTDIDQTSIPRSAFEDPSNGIRTSVAPVGRAATYRVTVQSLPGSYLPVVNQPTAVRPSGGDASLAWSSVGDFASVDSVTNLVEASDVGEDYTFESLVPTPTVTDLVTAGSDGDEVVLGTQLPTGQESLVARAREIVAAAGAEQAIDQVLAIQDHFTGPDSVFVYSTDVPSLRGTSALEQFVLEDQVGYCEYFATAMAVMVRGLGIPARVATGYLPGREVAAPTGTAAGVYQVSSTDAHAWVEVAFEDVGWVTFDPTPRSDTAGMRPSRDSLAPFGANAGAAGEPSDLPSEDDLLGASEAPQAPQEPVAVPGSGGAVDEQAMGPLARVATVVAVLLAVALLGLVAAWWWARRPRTATDPGERVLLAQSQLLVTAAALGRGRRPDETLHEVVQRWIDSGDVDGPSAQLVAARASEVAFGGDEVEVTTEQAAEVEEAAARLSQQLRDAASRQDRLLAEVRRITATP